MQGLRVMSGQTARRLRSHAVGRGCPDVLAHWQVSCTVDTGQVQLATGVIAKDCTDHVESYVFVLLSITSLLLSLPCKNV